MQEDRYYIIYDWMVQVIEQVKPLQVYALLFGLCTKQGGSAAVSNAYIMQRTGLQAYDVRRSLKYLSEGGFINRTQGNGRGGVSSYIINEKGLQNIHPLQDKKGNKINTLSNEKRVTNFNIKGNKFAPLNINNNKYTTTPKGAGACEEKESAEDMVRRVLTDNEERMAALCMQNSIPPNGTLTETLRPFIEDFILGEKAADTDYYLQDAKEIRRHFANWLRKNKHRVIVNILDKDNDDTGTHTTSENDTGASIQGAVVTGYSQRISRDIERVARSLL